MLGKFPAFTLGGYNRTHFVASYGTAKSGVGISAMSVLRPDLMIKCSIPVVMAGIVGVCILACSSAYNDV